MTWDGVERRKMSGDERDLLIRIDTNLTNHIAVMATHVIDDNIKFNEVKKDLAFNNKILYGALGIIAFIELLSKFK